ncbi:MAG TPA: hypothetical protein VN428_16235 [Bryobacteraceae bacterium]|nr:hypothetical protein [Bryobacteraceae bacterium]
MHIRRFVIVAVVAFSLGSLAQSTDSKPQDPGEALADSLVQWKTDCSPKGCLMQTDVLRGHSDDPPNAGDFREYVSIDVGISRKTQKPMYFAFFVDPGAAQDNGIFITFSKTTREHDSWKLNLDPEGPSRLMFEKCNENNCLVRVQGGLVQEGKERHEMNLLDKFLTSDHLLILYMKDGKAYRTMVILSSFKKAYQRVMTDELSSKPSAQ